MNRSLSLARVQEESLWDIIVIGGGATGLGIAVDAAKRGFKVLLLEKNDFAKGTSSRSTKLVHGGVRYLAQGNIKLVMEALRERGYLLKNAPHLTRVQQFIIPAYSQWQKWFYGIGLFAYDLLSGKLSLGRPGILSKKGVLNRMPSTASSGLKGGIMYTDGQFDDARLAIALAQTATDFGGVLINYMSVTNLLKDTTGKVSGVQAFDELEEKEYTFHSKAVVNATGVFVDQVLALDDPSNMAMVMPSQGVHLVVDRSFFPGTAALMIPKTTDGRVLFALPWHHEVVIGTTDTALNMIDEDPVALDEEVEFIISNFNQYSSKQISKKDVKTVFAGLRPLVKSSNAGKTSLASRDHTIMVSKSSLVTITGGKWTTYRKMAKDAVNNAAFVAKLPIVKCATRNLRLHGFSEGISYGDRLSSYGSDAETIRAYVTEQPSLGEKMHPDFEYIMAEVLWSVKEEMAMTVDDILSRRTRMLFLDAKAAISSAPKVARLMADALGKDDTWIQEQLADFNDIAETYLVRQP